MPLRAKIVNPTMVNGSQPYSSSVIKELPGDEPKDVLFSSLYGLRTIQLNRPKKLNSLNGSMIRKILPRMQEWEKSDLANVIVMKGEGRAFCAGGDVAALAEQNGTSEGQQASTDYFALEYQLDHYIATYPKPYVAFLDGITMGGGVGLSVHAPFRIATENTVFAMPETTIGFFPDVGASFFLPRMDGQLGLYLALTSEQLKGPNVFFSGIATHYLHSSSLPDLETRFSELRFRDSDDYNHRLQIINSTIEEFNTGLPHDKPISEPVAGMIRNWIDYVFQDGNDLTGMMAALDECDGSEPVVRAWAAKTKKTISQRSPTSVRVAIKQFREGRHWSIVETFRREHKIAAHFMQHPDFVEGVSSLLIRKPKTTPRWQPTKAEEVTDAQVDAFFSAEPDLELLRTGAAADYRDYPYAWTSLPREDDVKKYIKAGDNGSQADVLDHFEKQSNFKQGVKEKVSDVLARNTKVEEGRLIWVHDN